MAFYKNLEEVSLSDYKALLKEADLVPSRLVLKESIDKNFTKLKNTGIKNVEELFQALKTKNKVHSFSKKYSIDENYLTILIRELKGYRQPPVKLRDFIGFSKDLVTRLESEGIKTALELYGNVKTPALREEFAAKLRIDRDELLRLTKHMDLSRARWVNHTFAYVLYEAGYTTVEKLANANIEDLHCAVNNTNAKLKIFKGKIGLHDIKLTVDAANDITFDIIYTD